MARGTALARWPKIVQNMVDDVEASFGQSDIPEQIAEGRRIQATLRIMKREIMQDKPLQYVTLQPVATCWRWQDVDLVSSSPLSSDGCPDIQSYNEQLESFDHITWHNCPWLFAECYLYRYVGFRTLPALS